MGGGEILPKYIYISNQHDVHLKKISGIYSNMKVIKYISCLEISYAIKFSLIWFKYLKSCEYENYDI